MELHETPWSRYEISPVLIGQTPAEVTYSLNMATADQRRAHPNQNVWLDSVGRG
jgi:hypothetical protein